MNQSLFVKTVVGAVVVVLGLAISSLAMAANPYAKLINGGAGTGCTEPLEKTYLQDLAKVTQLPSGIMQVIKIGSLEYYAKTNEAEVIGKCSITDPGDEGAATSISKWLFRKLWLTMTGKSDVSTIEGIALLGPDKNIPMIEFRLPSTSEVVEISEPLVFGDPEKKYNWLWNNGYVLSITSSPWNSWITEINTQLQPLLSG